MTRQSPIAFVANSSVRTDVLLTVAEYGPSTRGLLERVDASESAIYNALSALERRALLVDSGDTWSATGRGQLIAGSLDAQRSLESILDAEYWDNHVTSPIPPRLQVRMGDLSDFDVIRAGDTDPYGVVREVSDRLSGSEDVEIVSPIYQPDYVETMPDAANARLVLDPSVLETAAKSSGDAVVREFEETDVRVLDVSLSIGVTESGLLLSLPTVDGEYDPKTSIVDESTSGIEWGGDLFEHFWSRARPVEEILHQFDL